MAKAMSRRKLSLEERRKVLETQPEVKWISIIDNNDEFAESRNHLIRMNQTKSMDNLLTDLTRSLKPHWGAVRNIYTPYGGTKVTNLDQLEPKKLYAVGGPKFRAINFGNRSKRSSWSNGHQSTLGSSDNSSSNKHSSESDRQRLRKKRGVHKALTPDDDYNEYFKNLYEKNKRIVTKSRRPLYESKQALTRRTSRRRNESNKADNLERSRSLNELTHEGSKPKSISPKDSPKRSASPPPVLQHQDSLEIRKLEDPRSSARSRDSVRSKDSGRESIHNNPRDSAGSIRSFHERGTFVNNSERNSGLRRSADRDSLHYDQRSETRVHSGTNSLRDARESEDEEIKYLNRKSPDVSSRKSPEGTKSPPGGSSIRSRAESQYERVLSGLSKLNTREGYESKDEGESAKSFAIRQMDSAAGSVSKLWKRVPSVDEQISAQENHRRFEIS